MDFSRLLIAWYDFHRRDLPWRETHDPYRIWVSEVILQQTRVNQGLDYYDRFIGRFPDVASLASAGEDEVMKAWQGLGYYSRARHLHQAARTIMLKLNGEFPNHWDDIRQLKGIGEYTAAAIASIAFGEPRPVVDGNVKRVVARYCGIREPVNTAAGINRVKSFLSEVMDSRQPGTFNQALMELGALVCIPKQPLCHQCPVRMDCAAFRENMTATLPMPRKKDPPKHRYLHYLAIISSENGSSYLWLKKRLEKDIWQNLYDFPLIEADRELTLEELRECKHWQEIFRNRPAAVDPHIEKTRHLLTHRILNVQFFTVYADTFSHDGFIKMGVEDLHNYPVPRVIEKYLKKFIFRPGIFREKPD